MLQIQDIYRATRDGLDIILHYYPQAEGVVGTKNKFRARTDERTPSAQILAPKTSGDPWRMIDYGGDGQSQSPLDIFMKEEGIVNIHEAVLRLGQMYNVRDELNHSINKPRIEKRPAKEGEEKGTPIYSLMKSIPEEHLKILGPRVKQEHVEALHWYEAEYVGYYKDGMVTLKYSTEHYPIFVRMCQIENGKAFYKVYEPLNPEKQWRFSYFPEGAKPKQYINGLAEMSECFAKLSADMEDEDGDNRLDEVFICSGERDALCCKSMGYVPVWFNSETYQITDKDLNTLYKYAKRIYNIPDIDSTGRRKGTEVALKYIDIYTIWLPTELASYRDNRGKSRKDLRDWNEIYRTQADFRNLIELAMQARFWDVTINAKGKKEYSISPSRLYYFLQLNGFHTLHVNNSASNRYVYVEGNVVQLVQPRDMRRFTRIWAEKNFLPEPVRNMIIKSKDFTDAYLESLSEVDLDFTTFTPTTQRFFFTKQNIEVTPKEILVSQNKNTNSFDYYVWKENIIPHEFSLLPDMFEITAREVDGKTVYDINILGPVKCNLLGYAINTSRIYWRKEMEERFGDDHEAAREYAASHKFCLDGEGLTAKEIAEQKQNFINKAFVIGYLLHRYKSPSRAWAPQAMDNKIGENGECNGRSGKSFLFKSLSMFMKSVKLSGRNSKLMDNPHVFDQVSIHTDFILVDDCAQYLSMQPFYDLITSDITVNPKNNPSYSIPFEDSPKFGFTTNYVPTDFDASTEARMLYMVFSDYYHQQSESNDYLESRSIRDDFGRDLYDKNYSEEDWNADINFLMQCLRFYLSVCSENVKILPPMDNIIYRKNKQSMGSNFEDWANTFFSVESDNLDKHLIRREVFETYRKYVNMPNLTMQGFTTKLKAFCALAPHIECLNPIELCNSQKRIMQRHNNVLEEMIYLKSVSKDQTGFLPFEK